jgi:hypothetical protein
MLPRTCLQSKTAALIQQRKLVICQESSRLKSEEIKMSIKAADSRKNSPAGEFDNRNPEENCFSRSLGDNPSNPPVITQIVPDSPHPHQDEPCSFHF